jgi:serine/threonine protein kinase
MQVGEILRDRYKIISRLGQGNFGETFLAEDLGIPIDPKPKCVVKRLKTQNFTDVQLDWVKNAFEQEATTLYNLGRLHPQIPNLSDLREYEVAIADYRQAAKLYKEQGKQSNYEDALNRIREIENRK